MESVVVLVSICTAFVKEYMCSLISACNEMNAKNFMNALNEMRRKARTECVRYQKEIYHKKARTQCVRYRSANLRRAGVRAVESVVVLVSICTAVVNKYIWAGMKEMPGPLLMCKLGVEFLTRICTHVDTGLQYGKHELISGPDIIVGLAILGLPTQDWDEYTGLLQAVITCRITIEILLSRRIVEEDSEEECLQSESPGPSIPQIKVTVEKIQSPETSPITVNVLKEVGLESELIPQVKVRDDKMQSPETSPTKVYVLKSRSEKVTRQFVGYTSGMLCRAGVCAVKSLVVLVSICTAVVNEYIWAGVEHLPGPVFVGTIGIKCSRSLIDECDRIFVMCMDEMKAGYTKTMLWSWANKESMLCIWFRLNDSKLMAVIWWVHDVYWFVALFVDASLIQCVLYAWKSSVKMCNSGLTFLLTCFDTCSERKQVSYAQKRLRCTKSGPREKTSREVLIVIWMISQCRKFYFRLVISVALGCGITSFLISSWNRGPKEFCFTSLAKYETHSVVSRYGLGFDHRFGFFKQEAQQCENWTCVWEMAVGCYASIYVVFCWILWQEKRACLNAQVVNRKERGVIRIAYLRQDYTRNILRWFLWAVLIASCMTSIDGISLSKAEKAKNQNVTKQDLEMVPVCSCVKSGKCFVLKEDKLQGVVCVDRHGSNVNSIICDSFLNVNGGCVPDNVSTSDAGLKENAKCRATCCGWRKGNVSCTSEDVMNIHDPPQGTPEGNKIMENTNPCVNQCVNSNAIHQSCYDLEIPMIQYFENGGCGVQGELSERDLEMDEDGDVADAFFVCTDSGEMIRSVVVTVLFQTRFLQLRILSNEPIATLKSKISGHLGIVPNDMVLMFAGHPLSDEKSVKDNNMVSDNAKLCIVQCLLKLRGGARTDLTFDEFKTYLNTKGKPSNFASLVNFQPSNAALKDKTNSWFWSALVFHACDVRGTNLAQIPGSIASAPNLNIVHAVQTLRGHFMSQNLSFEDTYVEINQLKFSKEFISHIAEYFETNHNEVALELRDWVRNVIDVTKQKKSTEDRMRRTNADFVDNEKARSKTQRDKPAMKQKKSAKDRIRRTNPDFVDAEKARTKRRQAEHPEPYRKASQKHRDKALGPNTGLMTPDEVFRIVDVDPENPKLFTNFQNDPSKAQLLYLYNSGYTYFPPAIDRLPPSTECPAIVKDTWDGEEVPESVQEALEALKKYGETFTADTFIEERLKEFLKMINLEADLPSCGSCGGRDSFVNSDQDSSEATARKPITPEPLTSTLFEKLKLTRDERYKLVT